jgi:hypothetical protein
MIRRVVSSYYVAMCNPPGVCAHSLADFYHLLSAGEYYVLQ